MYKWCKREIIHGMTLKTALNSCAPCFLRSWLDKSLQNACKTSATKCYSLTINSLYLVKEMIDCRKDTLTTPGTNNTSAPHSRYPVDYHDTHVREIIHGLKVTTCQCSSFPYILVFLRSISRETVYLIDHSVITLLRFLLAWTLQDVTI